MSGSTDPKKNASGASAESTPAAFGEMFEETGNAGTPGLGVRPARGGAQAGGGSRGPVRSGGGPYYAGGSGETSGARSSPNLGLQRKTGRKRVVGGVTSVRTVGTPVLKSYNTSGTIQFNDVEELRGDAVSRAFAQELLERLWARWGLDTSEPETMRKAEDLVHATIAMRTASPDAIYDIPAMVGQTEVNVQDLSDLLASEEVTRRRFARGLSDDIRAYITDPENVRLRDMLCTELGVKSEYASFAFDGSTHCSGMSPNQVMFTKQLERMNLFDTAEVRDRLASNQMLATGQFQVNRGKGGYN